jgi:tetratricopeptide (TPR) repeat protein
MADPKPATYSEAGRQRNVFDRLSKLTIGVVAVGVLAASAWAQAKAPAVKDQGEYDLTQAFQKETDPVKKLDILKQWQEKYPDSDFKGTRALATAQTESQIGAKALQPNAPAADLDNGMKAEQDLVANLGTYLSPDNKPANVTDAQWAQAKSQLELQAHYTLATIAVAKKDDATAEAEYKKVLAIQPDNAQTDYALGTLIIKQRKAERYPEALYYIARATAITGPNALNAQGKQVADTFLGKAYEGYHGSKDGLDDVKTKALTATLMPPDFTIESISDIQKKQEGDAAAFAAAHPDIALWRQIRDALKGPDGETYFTSTLKDAGIPPESGPFKMFTGKVISQPTPKDVLLNVDGVAGDVTLNFENPLKGMPLDPGTAVKFKGQVDSFVKDPYMLTLKVDKEDVEGIPASAFAGAPAARRKKAAPKKAAQ